MRHPKRAIRSSGVQPIPVNLSGVPETLLGNLGRRAAAARMGVLKDPMAIQVVDRLHYDFSDATRGVRLHAVRVGTFDHAVRRFLGSYPAGTVVALGEGLETQFWRLDNGQPRQVHGLITGIAERLPRSVFVFDVVPEVMLDVVRRASGRERDLAVDLWTWLFSPAEYATVGALAGVEELRDLAPPLNSDLLSVASLSSAGSHGGCATRCR